jgi:lycopene beta-cyclase
VSTLAGTDLDVAVVPGVGAQRALSPGLVPRHLPTSADVVIIGGGCSGLATAVHLAALPGERSVLVLEGRTGSDPRSWCSWDDGSDPLPEARSASWERWSVRTDSGTSVGTDPDHPYVLVRGSDRRAAAERRLGATGAVTVVDGTPASAITGDADADADADADGLIVGTRSGSVRAGAVLDARGPRCPDRVPEGRVLLHQRFVGQWIVTPRPVFDPSTVTLMDFTGQESGGPVRFIYVLPVSTTEALVESTVFTPDAADPLDHRGEIADYLQRRWDLGPGTWRATDEESGCIPMTDIPPVQLTGRHDDRWHPEGTHRVETVIGTTRPSSGYGFARSNRHSRAIARHLASGTPVPELRDRPRTRFLDAVFLRFLRDRPECAAEAFRRLLALPGPLVVRFMAERSTVADDLRIILALQKGPFLAALAHTLVDAVRRGCRRRSRPTP